MTALGWLCGTRSSRYWPSLDVWNGYAHREVAEFSRGQTPAAIDLLDAARAKSLRLQAGTIAAVQVGHVEQGAHRAEPNGFVPDRPSPVRPARAFGMEAGCFELPPCRQGWE